MENCIICENEFLLSDPQTFSFENGKTICRKCWEIVFDTTSWGAKKEMKVIYEYKKVSIPHSLKWKVWKRDNFTCKKCGSQENLSIDHITPESLGGTLEESNLQTLCLSCNKVKSSYG